jgi:LytS/YehU family sensor histidine kinase
LQNLKNQLNPHFLFNNLSVLTSLVYKNQDKAVDFISELAKVYRYVLDTKNSELVSLNEELEFIYHYIYLQKIRFEDSISFEINIEESKKSDYLLPMCLQMLVENTIQHNETSQAHPLKVLIYTEKDSLVIENLIKPRSNNSESTKTGLKNIEQRYLFFTDKKVIVSNNGKIFKVILPLIQKK